MKTSVYQYFDSLGVLLYVGVTARGVRRSQEHADSKKWWPLAVGSTIEHFDSRSLALSREQDLIERFKPPYNAVHNDRRVEARTHYETTRPPSRGVQGDSLKLRIQNYHNLSKAEKRVTPCVNCGIRPTNGRPQCAVCKPPKSPVVKAGSNEQTRNGQTRRCKSLHGGAFHGALPLHTSEVLKP